MEWCTAIATLVLDDPISTRNGPTLYDRVETEVKHVVQDCSHHGGSPSQGRSSCEGCRTGYASAWVVCCRIDQSIPVVHPQHIAAPATVSARTSWASWSLAGIGTHSDPAILSMTLTRTWSPDLLDWAIPTGWPMPISVTRVSVGTCLPDAQLLCRRWQHTRQGNPLHLFLNRWITIYSYLLCKLGTSNSVHFCRISANSIWLHPAEGQVSNRVVGACAFRSSWPAQSKSNTIAGSWL
jgi:hypothetical protein